MILSHSSALKGDYREITYGNGQKMQYGYDGYGRLTSTTQRDGNGAVSAVWRYRYGNNGEILEVMDEQQNTVTSVQYDLSNRPRVKTTCKADTGEHVYTGMISYGNHGSVVAFNVENFLIT